MLQFFFNNVIAIDEEIVGLFLCGKRYITQFTNQGGGVACLAFFTTFFTKNAISEPPRGPRIP